MYYPEFRISELTIMPWHENNFRVDIELATYDGQYNQTELTSLEAKTGKRISNIFQNIVLRLECGKIPNELLKDLSIEIENGSSEDSGGLVQLCLDWVIYLRNVRIEFKQINGEIFTIWNAESENISEYVDTNSSVKYELAAKINKITKLNSCQELLQHSKEIVKGEIRYKEIISKLKGEQPSKVILENILPLGREFEYSDSKHAWSLVQESSKIEPLRNPWG